VMLNANPIQAVELLAGSREHIIPLLPGSEVAQPSSPRRSV
jgi:hypothetical protein